MLRGNIHTRVKKLINEEYDAIILAAAGLERVNDIKAKYLYQIPQTVILPAVGQGVLCCEFRSDDKNLKSMLEPLIHEPTNITAHVERQLNKSIGGSCQTPVAGFASLQGENITLDAWVGSKINTYYTASRTVPFIDYLDLGGKVASDIMAQGEIDWQQKS